MNFIYSICSDGLLCTMAEPFCATSKISHYHAFLKVLTLQPFTRMQWAALVRKKVSELVRESEFMEPLITDTAVVIPSEPGEFVDLLVDAALKGMDNFEDVLSKKMDFVSVYQTDDITMLFKIGRMVASAFSSEFDIHEDVSAEEALQMDVDEKDVDASVNIHDKSIFDLLGYHGDLPRFPDEPDWLITPPSSPSKSKDSPNQMKSLSISNDDFHSPFADITNKRSCPSSVSKSARRRKRQHKNRKVVVTCIGHRGKCGCGKCGK